MGVARTSTIVAVESLEIIGIDRRALRRIRVVDVGQLGCSGRILHDLEDLAAEELAGGVVRCLARQQIAESRAELQPALLPGRFIQGLPLLGWSVERRSLGNAEGMRVVGLTHDLPDLGRVLLDIALELLRQGRVARRHAVVRGALKHGQMGGSLGDDWSGLDAGGTGADQPHALAGEIHAFVRPLPGVVPASREAFEARDVGNIGRGQAADGGDEELRNVLLACLRAHAPPVRRRIVMRRSHAGVEADAALKVEALGDVVQIAQDLRLRGIALRPLPLLRQLIGERVAVRMALGIAARARVAVPVPRAADPFARLQPLDRQAEPIAQAEQLIEAGKTCTDDQRVEDAWWSGSAFWGLRANNRHCYRTLKLVIVPSVSALYCAACRGIGAYGQARAWSTLAQDRAADSNHHLLWTISPGGGDVVSGLRQAATACRAAARLASVRASDHTGHPRLAAEDRSGSRPIRRVGWPISRHRWSDYVSGACELQEPCTRP
jgi:hypothetical protein